MKFGCCISKTEDVKKVREAGFDFFEFAGFAAAKMTEAEFNTLCAVSEAEKLPCIGFNAYSSNPPVIVGEGFSTDAAREYASLLCHRGKRLKINAVGIGSPLARNMPVGMSRDEADKQFLKFMDVTAEVARDYEIDVLIEAVHSGMCNYLTLTPEASAMVEQLNLPNVGMVLDFYHMAWMGEEYSSAEAAAPYLRHVHFSTAGEGLRRGFPQKQDEMEYRRIFAVLRKIGYTGTVSIEPTEFDLLQAKTCLSLMHELDTAYSE